MKIAIRDDDTCYFTQPQALERVYGDVWDRIPICLATVPFTVGYTRPDIPREHWAAFESFPLDRNASLVVFLRDLIQRRRVSIALHGYTHQDYPSGYEFQAAPDPERRVHDGLRYLSSTLGTRISIFVPPHNALSKRGLSAIAQAGLNLLGSFLSFRPSMRPWDVRTPANWARVARFRRATGRTRRHRFVYPFVLRYTRHAEFGCHSLIPGTTTADLLAGLEEAKRFGGDFCLATHHWEINSAMKRTLIEFLEAAARIPDARFVAAEELFA